MIYYLLGFTAAQRERAQEDFKVLYEGAPPYPSPCSHMKDSMSFALLSKSYYCCYCKSSMLFVTFSNEWDAFYSQQKKKRLMYVFSWQWAVMIIIICLQWLQPDTVKYQA